MNYEKRQKLFRSWIKREELDAFLVTDLSNVRYLCGFTGSNGTILFGPDENRFFTDGRYKDQSNREVVGMEISVAVGKSIPQQLKSFVPYRKGKKTLRLGVEADDLTILQHGLLQDALGDNVELEPTHNAVRKLRMQKDAGEIALIRKASQITISVFGEVLSHLQPGVTERQIARLIRNLMEDAGAEGEAFETIVLFGKRTSLVHGKPDVVPLKKNDLILMDFGARFNGYCSDFTRTFTFNKASKTVSQAFDAVKHALRTTEKRISPGRKCSSYDTSVREYFEKMGEGEKFLHSLGHGVGLEIHEGPRLALPSEETLRKGMVITVEPGLYSGTWGGIRLENLLVVTAKGAENLTPFPLELTL